MTNKIYKRTYRIAFHPNVVKMIDGAREGTYACWGFHDLLDHNHEDEEIMENDTALKSTFKKLLFKSHVDRFIINISYYISQALIDS